MNTPVDKWGWLRPGASVIAGMWIAVHLHKAFWTWAPIYSFGILLSVHILWLIVIFIKFSIKWWGRGTD